MIRINLLPTKKKPLIIPPTLVYGVIATVLVLAALIVFTVYMNKKVTAMQAEISTKEQKLNQLKTALKEVENYEKDNAEYRQKVSIIEQLKKNQIVPLRLLDEVSEMLPKGVWLVNLTDRMGTVSIEGYSFSNPDLVNYVQKLKGSKYLVDVNLVQSRQETLEGVSVYKFSLTLRIRV